MKALILCFTMAYVAACGDTSSVAGDYKKFSADATPKKKEEEKKEEKKEEEKKEGDASKGNTLLTSCIGCHKAGGSGAAVTLNADAIPRLDQAYTGGKKAFHSGFKDAFEQPGRADLEAALKVTK